MNFSPQIDSIAEFQVQSAMVSAEYPRASINVVTKSGSNVLHGSAFEFLRNNVLHTRPFNLPGDLPEFRRNQFGGTLGGPIKKNKLFAFFGYEGLRVRQAAASLTTPAVPSALQRQGNFTQTKGGIFEPDTLGNGVGQQFPGNIIPASRINPLASAAMNAMPLPSNIAAGTFVNAAEVLQQNNDSYQGRVDYTVNAKWTMFGRYSIGDESAIIPGVVPGRETNNPARSQNAAIGAVAVLTSNMVNEARLGFSRLWVENGTPEPLFTVNGAKTELPQFTVNPYPLMGGAGAFVTTATGGWAARTRANTFHAYDNFSWYSCCHSINFVIAPLKVQT